MGEIDSNETQQWTNYVHNPWKVSYTCQMTVTIYEFGYEYIQTTFVNTTPSENIS